MTSPFDKEADEALYKMGKSVYSLFGLFLTILMAAFLVGVSVIIRGE